MIWSSKKCLEDCVLCFQNICAVRLLVTNSWRVLGQKTTQSPREGANKFSGLSVWIKSGYLRRVPNVNSVPILEVLNKKYRFFRPRPSGLTEKASYIVTTLLKVPTFLQSRASFGDFSVRLRPRRLIRTFPR